MPLQVLELDTDVLADLLDEAGADVVRPVIRHDGHTPVCVGEDDVAPPLSYGAEPEPVQSADELAVRDGA